MVRGGLLPAGNDETDGLLRETKGRATLTSTRGASGSLLPVEGEKRASRRREGPVRGSLMKCRHYRYRTEPTSAPVCGRGPGERLYYPRTHTLPEVPLWERRVLADARARRPSALTSLPAIGPFTARDGLTAVASRRNAMRGNARAGKISSARTLSAVRRLDP